MYGRKSINGNVEWLGVTLFLHNDEPPWTDSILVPSPRWGVGGTYEIWALESQPGGRYDGVDVLWRGAVPAREAYLPQSPEMCAPMCAASATISFGSTVWRTPKASRIPGTPPVTSWSIERIAPWMIFGTNQFLNNFLQTFR